MKLRHGYWAYALAAVVGCSSDAPQATGDVPRFDPTALPGAGQPADPSTEGNAEPPASQGDGQPAVEQAGPGDERVDEGGQLPEDTTLIEGEMPAPDGSENPMEVVAEEPTAEEPAVEEPVTEPVVDEPVTEEPAPSGTQVFLLFGQSNMYGTPPPDQQDLAATARVEVLTLQGCQAHGANQFVPAQPPLHGCVGQPSFGPFGPGLGPGDYFGKAVAEAFPQDTIILVPNAIAGVPISTFAPGQQAYNSIVARARMAQERGPIAGMLFHQGESDSGNPNGWVNAVAQVVSSLKRDLGLGDVPFVAGELPYDGCCGGHNSFVNQLPGSIPNTRVASAQGLGTYVETQGMNAGQRLHFNTAAQRALGGRYADVFLTMVGQ